jgi:glycosyltransferase involved in cell wall biosynthesis
LDSIFDQTLRDIEIIVINDGSTDNSLKIIREYEKLDSRIVVIDKKNEGLGKTYNCGLDAATAPYIGFVESDDWIEPDMYETLYTLAEKNNTEVTLASFFVFDDATGENKSQFPYPLPHIDKIVNPLACKEVIINSGCAIWSGIYRANFLRANGIRFNESSGASYQDIAFNLKVLMAAERAYFTLKPLVHYRNGHTAQSVKSENKLYCVCDELSEVERWLKSRDNLTTEMIMLLNRRRYDYYRWNLKRLNGDNHAAFLARFQDEFRLFFENYQIDMTGLNNHNKLKMMRNLYPDSTRIKIKLLLSRIMRGFYKNKIRHGFKEHYLLGVIPVVKHKLK